ncbi:PREDICTED: DTW domain-containing protein 2-like [Rhagoletis zephyria]|uniref:DTW domain-containing protein 2-like n=1 Tax=Rhagoletis zephyria TaxID=28612 RepID=UPI0008114721|nr:PREDICTED: DTW domain-containing protein 2-like [Rhagoletis zephyria]
MEELDEAWNDFVAIDADPPPKREICSRCERPNTACYCSAITPSPIPLRNHLIMLQHPNEVKRCLRTTKIIELSLPPSHYHLYRAKRFTPKRFPDLFALLDSGERENILLFPSPTAVPLASLPPIPEKTGSKSATAYNIVVLDGTWSQAKVMFNSNATLRSMRSVALDNTAPSRYVIRTQPTETCLSTVEAVALLLAHLEEQPDIVELLTSPLKTICDHQINNGAVEHQSKEYLITNGLYGKPLKKRVKKYLDLNLKLNIKDLVC